MSGLSFLSKTAYLRSLKQDGVSLIKVITSRMQINYRGAKDFTPYANGV